MTQSTALQRSFFLLAFAVVSFASVEGAVVIQRAGESYVAWEAEDFWTNEAANNNPWQVVADTDASNGLALRANGNNHSAPGGGIATYQLQFVSAATYRLYFRMNAPDGGSDSVFRAASFDVAPTEPPYVHVGQTGGVYQWCNDHWDASERYKVDPGDLGTTLKLSVGSRENNFRVDRFVLSTNTDLSDAELDALLNWDTYNHFTGSSDSDWSEGENWQLGVVPKSTTIAYIGDGKTADLDASAAVRQLRIGHTDATLRGNGTLSQTAGDMTVVERLAVGEMTVGSAGETITGSYTASADTSLTIGESPTSRADLVIAYNDVSGTADNASSRTVAEGTLDLSAASDFNAYLDSLVLGEITFKQYARANGTLKLAETNTIDALTIMISDIAHPYSSGTSDVVLGTTNTVRTNLLTVGGQRGLATMGFADGASGGSLILTGPIVGDEPTKADLHIAYTDADTGNRGRGDLDLSGGTFNATLGEVVIGYREARARDHADNRATLAFDNGTVTADSMVLGSVGWSRTSDSHAVFPGTLNMNGGSFSIDGDVTAGLGRNPTGSGGGASNRSAHGIGTINVSGGQFSAASMALGVGEHDDNVVARGTGTLNISGEAGVAITGDLTLGVGHPDSIGTINLTGGTLAAQSISGGVGTAHFNWTDGTLHVGTFGDAERRFDLVQDGGTLAPGNSIGTTNVYGNYTMNGGVLEIEIAGPGTGGVDYDMVMIDGNATLAGTLGAVLIGGFLPDLGTHFDVMHTTGWLDIDELSLDVGSSSLGFGWWEMAAIPGVGGHGATLRLSAVPEPTGALLALLALAGWLGCFRPRRHAG